MYCVHRKTPSANDSRDAWFYEPQQQAQTEPTDCLNLLRDFAQLWDAIARQL